MKYFFRILLVSGIFLLSQSGLSAAPWEVLSDISYLHKGGVNAVRIDFALPVHYVTHFPVKHGKSVTIDIRFSRSSNIRSGKNEIDPSDNRALLQSEEIIDISELPLLQTLQAPESLLIPLKQVTYFREGDEPKLLVEFEENVNFSVSQVMGITSLVIFLPTTKKPDIVDLDVIPIEKEIPVSEETFPGPDDEKAKKFLDEGRAALKQGDNKKAVLIFTKLLSMSKHAYVQTSLEFLGLARDRNNQAAQAKAIYKQYLKQYLKGDGATRVRQRLADLISSRSKPRKRLKKTKTSERAKKSGNVRVFGSLAQYLDYRAIETDREPREATAAVVVNQLSLNLRARAKGYDVRSYFYANYDYDTVDGETDALEIGSMYAKVRNSGLGINATLGRQSASTAGVLGKFDGVLMGYQITEKLHINIVHGYLVDTYDKGEFQSSRPFTGGSLELNNVIDGLDMSPYWFRHMLDNVTDRNAVGTDARYINDLVNIYGLIDYDIYFGRLNFLSTNGQYKYEKNTSITFSFDRRNSPSLETGNALIQLDEDTTIEDLENIHGLTEAVIKEMAEDRTGQSTTFSAGVNHVYNDQITLAGDITWSQYISKALNVVQREATDGNGNVMLDVNGNPVLLPIEDQDVIATNSTTEKENRTDYTVRLVAREGFHPRDMSISYVRWTDAKNYNEFTYSATYRRPVGTKWRMNFQLKVKNRDSNSGETLVKKIPSIKLDNRASRDLQFYIEASQEYWDYSGLANSVNEDVKFYNLYGGYSWTF